MSHETVKIINKIHQQNLSYYIICEIIACQNYYVLYSIIKRINDFTQYKTNTFFSLNIQIALDA